MISKQEIMRYAKKVRLAPEIVERDYVIGWLLAGIYHHQVLAKDWVFKGGTCLKKCFFESYRFSQDLDFTLKNNKHVNQSFLESDFAEIGEWIYDAAGIEIPADSIRFKIYKNPRGKLSIEGGISYRGPLQRQNNLPRIKLDLTYDEFLVLKPEQRRLHHPYSDNPRHTQIQCYCFEEIFAEKLRALFERVRPRDLYDVFHLYHYGRWKFDHKIIHKTFIKKCTFKNLPEQTMEMLQKDARTTELRSEWKNMLAHQLYGLPPVEKFWNELPKVFEWLRG